MGQHYMTYAERIRLEEKLRYKVPVAEIARKLGFSRQTIYNEIRRGSYEHEKNGFLERRYSADRAQDIFERKQLRKAGRPLKIGHELAYANFLERKILTDHFSPAAALAAARAEGFTMSICVNTVYHYIEQGVFYQLTSNDLWEKPRRRKKKPRPAQRIAHKDFPSIEQRPHYINEREQLGHWEMDLIIGKAQQNAALLTLTERSTRQEIIRKVPDKKSASIVAVLDEIEKSTPGFRQKFRSITTDNGPEFLDYDGLRRSIREGTRCEVYYCHSYASWEKGTNERSNRIIRRWFPKGTDFTEITEEQIQQVEDWMNHYPRKVLGWKTPAELAADSG